VCMRGCLCVDDVASCIVRSAALFVRLL